MDEKEEYSEHLGRSSRRSITSSDGLDSMWRQPPTIINPPHPTILPPLPLFLATPLPRRLSHRQPPRTLRIIHVPLQLAIPPLQLHLLLGPWFVRTSRVSNAFRIITKAKCSRSAPAFSPPRSYMFSSHSSFGDYDVDVCAHCFDPECDLCTRCLEVLEVWR